jgi:chondroitin 4-sulfotransferase 11
MESNKRREIVKDVCQLPDRKKAGQRFNWQSKHFIVNVEHKVIVCYIPKVGCTTMKKLFMVMANLYPSFEKADIATHVHREDKLLRLGDKGFTDEQRNYMLKDFYKFMIVRDPFERLVSAYRNKFQNNSTYYFTNILKKRIIRRDRKNKKLVKAGDDDDVTFTEFVRYLIDTPHEQLNAHWKLYEDICSPCNVKYNFIGSIDTLERDLAYVMRKIHANETKYHVKQSSSALAITKAATASFFKKVPKEYFDQLLAVRKTDFELFGYPLPKYESLDKHYHA